MTAFLTLDSIAASTPDRRLLFQDLTFALGCERVGLVGRNGAGKSTLLRILVGDQAAASGTVTRAGTLGVLMQDWPSAITLAEALGIAPALAVVRRVLAGTGDDADFAAADWTLESRVEAAFAASGLGPVPLDRQMGTLSGGERVRVGLARLRIEQPDVLLLDEPTNNLDAPGRAAVAALMADWRGGVIVASHDRDLLERVDRIVELTPLGIRMVGGGWSAFEQARNAEQARILTERDRAVAGERAARDAMQRQREAKERRDKAGRTFAARKSEPRILLGRQAERAENSGGQGRRIAERGVAEARARADEARARVEVLAPLTIALPPTGLAGQAHVITLDAVRVQAGALVLGPWTLEVKGPERIGITGRNGAGKSTLLRIMAGMVRPSAGIVRRGDIRAAMIDQHSGLLDRSASILANVRRHNPALDEQAAYAACARFAFRNRDALALVETLSGGERLRAALACVLGGSAPPCLLLLDEPTNHLDLASIGVLERALKGYDGALVVVSHDPAFLRAIGIERALRLDD